MSHTRQQWMDKIRDRLGDRGVIQQVTEERIEDGLVAAFAKVSNDRPREVAETFNGDGSTYDFTLNDGGAAEDDWIQRWSKIISVEYPKGEREPVYLEPVRDYIVLARTADLRLLNDTPSSTESLEVVWTTRWPFPDDTTNDEIPDPWYEAVASLAASEAARAQGISFARRQSSSIAGVDILYDPQDLFDAAGQLRRLYDDIVLGVDAAAGDGQPISEVAIGAIDQDHFPRALFHRRSSWTP